jgi:hypothetical protein
MYTREPTMEPAMDYPKCPACNATRRNKTDVIGVFECRRCGAIYGTCYLGESYGLVKPFFATEDVPPERCRYFDFTTLGSAGVDRRHGWFDTESRRVVQIG